MQRKKRQNPSREVIGKSSLTISAKPVGAWGCVSAIDSNGRTIWIADAHRDDGKRFVVRADEKLTAFLELESRLARKTHALIYVSISSFVHFLIPSLISCHFFLNS